MNFSCLFVVAIIVFIPCPLPFSMTRMFLSLLPSPSVVHCDVSCQLFDFSFLTKQNKSMLHDTFCSCDLIDWTSPSVTFDPILSFTRIPRVTSLYSHDDSGHDGEEHHDRHDEEWRRRVQVHVDIHDRLDDGQDNDGKPKRQSTGGRGEEDSWPAERKRRRRLTKGTSILWGMKRERGLTRNMMKSHWRKMRVTSSSSPLHDWEKKSCLWCHLVGMAYRYDVSSSSNFSPPLHLWLWFESFRSKMMWRLGWCDDNDAVTFLWWMTLFQNCWIEEGKAGKKRLSIWLEIRDGKRSLSISRW